MSERPDINMLHGSSDDAFGTQVWLGRVSGLASHLRIIRNHIPDGPMADWLRNQCDAGLDEAERYSLDAKPSDSETCE